MKITIVGNKEGVFIDPTNCNAFVNPADANNYKAVDLKGINHLVIRREDNENTRIIQASGWSYDRGMFIDMY